MNTKLVYMTLLTLLYYINAMSYFIIVHCMLNQNPAKKKWMFTTIYILYGMIIVGKQFVKLLHPLNNSNYLLIILVVIIQWLYIFCFYTDTVRTKILCLGFLLSSSIISDVTAMSISVFILKLPIDTVCTLNWPNITTTSISTFLLLFITSLFIKLKHKKFDFHIQTYSETFILFTVNIIIAFPATLFFNNAVILESRSDILFLIILLQSGTIPVVVMYCAYICNKKAAMEYQTRLINEQMQAELKLNSLTKDAASQLKKLRHDMKEHYGIIRFFAQRKDYEPLKEYIDSIYKELEEASDIYTNISTPLALLFQNKKKTAREKGIRISIICCIQEFGMSDKDLVQLFSNILNNAIEASQQCPENNRRIDMEILPLENQSILITCLNTRTQQKLVKNSSVTYRTTKKDKNIHGLGMKIIADTVKKYGGGITEHYSDSEFSLRISYPHNIKKQ